VVHSGAATSAAGGATNGSVGPIIGTSEVLRKAVEKAWQLADLDVPVLLQGETGVGKEMFARTITREGVARTAPSWR